MFRAKLLFTAAKIFKLALTLAAAGWAGTAN
jgi:hypothetical protein